MKLAIGVTLLIFSAMPYSQIKSVFHRLHLDSQHPVTRFIRVFIAGLMALLISQPVPAQERYTMAQIQAERFELDNAHAENKDSLTNQIDLRIKEASNDPVRHAALLIFKAENLRSYGMDAIEENLSRALSLISPMQHPELYIYAMTIRSYGMYTYQNLPEEATALLESLKLEPALKNAPYVHIVFLRHLLEIYYKRQLFEKIPHPLFQLSQVVKKGSVASQHQDYLYYLSEELAYHSGLIGDLNQAIDQYNQLINHYQQTDEPDHVAIIYCNIANMYFLPFQEKVRYAQASLSAHNNIACSDVMDKIVLLGEIQQGNFSNVNRLMQFNPMQQIPHLNESSAYYAGLSYLLLGNVSAAQEMADRITENNNWERHDLLQKIYQKQGNYQAAFEASQHYHQLKAEKDAEARSLMLSSFQTRLALAQEETLAAEQEKQAARIAAAEQKAKARLHITLIVISAGALVTLILSLYLLRSRQHRMRLQQLSDTDPLTGLLNRRAFLHQASQMQRLAERQQFPLSIALLDLDFFKAINDKHGHHVGDAVLRAFAQAAKTTLRQTDIIGRFGGEEFILLATEKDPAVFAGLLQRLQRTFIQACEQDPAIGLSVSFSAGIATVGVQNAAGLPDIEDAIRQADEQLYRAKANGRQQVCAEMFCLHLTGSRAKFAAPGHPATNSAE
ncbi:GGDEF domain-containing protein [Shewanella litorisediminis]|uniref:diguanylate cyclase n=1 Tax=Shewanella litorisediminis TaxID=1173586 RepID=A0ABX7G3F0_9GAMM|nr:GGDEF domain-containing protein [Shewanella litorisediminis]MCL2917344.1 GGDEF domain-containing protein [Shewanella litorisediminis]QRH01812.1 GGDEF domain-containing protein [Shewanella litorisediminis]